MPGPNALLIRLRVEAEAVNVMCRPLTLARRSAVPKRNGPTPRRRGPFVHSPPGLTAPADSHTLAPDRPAPQGMILTWLLLRPRDLLRARAFFLPPGPILRQRHGHRLNAGQRGDDQRSPMALRTKGPSRSRAFGPSRPERPCHKQPIATHAGPRFWHQPLLIERLAATTLVGFHRADYNFVLFSNPWLAELHLRKRS
jgi:hypothetical protein